MNVIDSASDDTWFINCVCHLPHVADINFRQRSEKLFRGAISTRFQPSGHPIGAVARTNSGLAGIAVSQKQNRRSGAVKRPQKRSKPKKKAALAKAGSISRDKLERMEGAARYRSSPYHKSRLSSSDPRIATRPRPDKTICDVPTLGDCRNAGDLLRAGFRRCMVSEQNRQGWPQNVWAVDDGGTVYEAQLSNSELGEYHGYPIKKDDGFASFIGEEWGRRRP